MRLVILVIIGVAVYWYFKNHSSNSGNKTSYSIPSEEQLEHMKQSTIDAARKRYEDRLNGLLPKVDESDVPMFSHMARFLGAVKLTREAGGQGSIILNKNTNQNTVSIQAHYCNYSCMSCMDKLLYDGALDYPGMTIVQGGDEDSFNYNVENVKTDDYFSSLQYLTHEIQEYLPGATITPNAERVDFVSVSFRT